MQAWRPLGEYRLAEEFPVAMVFDGTTQAVMMASPADLEEFLLGFALTEGLIAAPAEIVRMEIIEAGDGVEARAWLGQAAGAAFKERRRMMLGPVGCGLCGIESIKEALRPLPRVTARLTPPDPITAMRALRDMQPLQDITRATHAAGFYRAGLEMVREDVGRHNALDKLAGALKGDASGGAIVMTSRLSVDLVQKAAALGAPVLIGAGAATARAVEAAQAAGIVLIGRVRADSFETYTEGL